MIQTEYISNHMIECNAEVALEQFRISFPYTRVNVQDGYMNYTTKRLDYARSIQREANSIIARLKLPLKTDLKINRYDAVLTIEPK